MPGGGKKLTKSLAVQVLCREQKALMSRIAVRNSTFTHLILVYVGQTKWKRPKHEDSRRMGDLDHPQVWSISFIFYWLYLSFDVTSSCGASGPLFICSLNHALAGDPRTGILCLWKFKIALPAHVHLEHRVCLCR